MIASPDQPQITPPGRLLWAAWGGDLGLVCGGQPNFSPPRIKLLLVYADINSRGDGKRRPSETRMVKRCYGTGKRSGLPSG